METYYKNHGFTLIELSIVLVIIGLIVGGVLVGQDLIRSAEVRAQVTQIEKYNQAVNTFRGKFGYLPGDMLNTAATQFGFNVGTVCNGTQAKRDGNGLIEGWGGTEPLVQGGQETALFWQDLSFVNLIDGTFPNSGIPVATCTGVNVTLSGSAIGAYFPAAKIGHSNYLYVYPYTGSNWYGLSAVTGTSSTGWLGSSTSIPTMQAYNMDKKIDDGLPTTGTVQAVYLSGGGTWPSVAATAPNTATAGGTAASCYDTTTGTYSVTPNGGAGANCALSFQFQ